jgi:hypothetical protein
MFNKCDVFNLGCFCLNSKRDNELLLKLIANLNMLLKDESVNVVKKAILTLTQLYKVALQVHTFINHCLLIVITFNP